MADNQTHQFPFILDFNFRFFENLTQQQTWAFFNLAFILVFWIIISLLARFLLGKESSLKNTIHNAFTVILAYTGIAILYPFMPSIFERLDGSLPFLTFQDGRVCIMPLLDMLYTDLPGFSKEFGSMVLLLAIMNHLGKYWIKTTRIGWFVVKVGRFVGSVFVHYMIFWFIRRFLGTTLSPLDPYIPMILMSALVIMLGIALFKLVMMILVTAFNPIFGALYAYFFGSPAGKFVSSAIFSSLMVAAMAIHTTMLGYGVLPLLTDDIHGYAGFTLVFGLAWWFIGRHG